MIIVVDKKTLLTRQFSTLVLACEAFEFEKKKGTLEKEKFPIILKDYQINKGSLEKTVYEKDPYFKRKNAK